MENKKQKKLGPKTSTAKPENLKASASCEVSTISFVTTPKVVVYRNPLDPSKAIARVSQGGICVDGEELECSLLQLRPKIAVFGEVGLLLLDGHHDFHRIDLQRNCRSRWLLDPSQKEQVQLQCLDVSLRLWSL